MYAKAVALAMRRGDLIVEIPSAVPQDYRYEPWPAWLYHHQGERKLVHSEDEARRLGPLWADSPQAAKAAWERHYEAIATAAAVRAYDDRRLGPMARAELDTYEKNADDYVLDVPAVKE